MNPKQRLQLRRMSLAKSALASRTLIVIASLSVAGIAGCAQENNNPGTGGSTAAGSGGASSGGATASGNSGGATASNSGGATASVSSGGATVSGSGGATASASGGSSAGGTTGGGGGGAPVVAAVCTTQAKGGACLTPTDACAKNCGPKTAANTTTGAKTETCTGGIYVEAACAFPAGDYACFKVSAATAACPAATASGGACTIDSCMPCSGYVDSSNTAKVGFCHCVNSKWSCGSTKEWPCATTGTSTSPGGTGC